MSTAVATKYVYDFSEGSREMRDLLEMTSYVGTLPKFTHYEGAIRDALFASDIYITFTHKDPCPNTVIEAMACGLPVVYSASGGVPELVGPEGGIGLPAPLDFGKHRIPHGSRGRELPQAPSRGNREYSRHPKARPWFSSIIRPHADHTRANHAVLGPLCSMRRDVRPDKRSR